MYVALNSQYSYVAERIKTDGRELSKASTALKSDPEIVMSAIR